MGSGPEVQGQQGKSCHRLQSVLWSYPEPTDEETAAGEPRPRDSTGDQGWLPEGPVLMGILMLVSPYRSMKDNLLFTSVHCLLSAYTRSRGRWRRKLRLPSSWSVASSQL